MVPKVIYITCYIAYAFTDPAFSGIHAAYNMEYF